METLAHHYLTESSKLLSDRADRLVRFLGADDDAWLMPSEDPNLGGDYVSEEALLFLMGYQELRSTIQSWSRIIPSGLSEREDFIKSHAEIVEKLLLVRSVSPDGRSMWLPPAPSFRLPISGSVPRLIAKACSTSRRMNPEFPW